MRHHPATMIRAHSFDVFDTLIVRTLARPVDVLWAAAERAVPADHGNGRLELVDEIVRRRRDAEAQARDRLARNAVALTDIYEELGDLDGLGVACLALRTAELAVDREEIRPVRAGAALVQAARDEGRRVIFISDMYLPSEHIRASLERFGIARPEDSLYVSGEARQSKLEGSLFDYVLRAEGLRPAELVHTGDDAITDRAMPARRRIGTEPATGAKLGRLEREVLSQATCDRHTLSRVVGTARASRVAHAPVDGPGVHAAALGAGVVGPLFAAFVAWVLRTAREDGVDRLYFVSRDGQLPLRIAAAIRRTGDPECRYLHGSRQAWLPAAVYEVSPASLAWVLEPRIPPVAEILDKLGLDAADAAHALARRGLDRHSVLRPDALGLLWDALEDLEEPILARSESSRRLALDYFAQEGLTDGTRWAMVDLGWRLSTQRAVRDILGADAGTRGYYFGVSNHKRVPMPSAGSYRAFILQDAEPHAGHLPEAWIWGNTSLIEHVFAGADHGSCFGYMRVGDRMVPQLRALQPDPDADVFRKLVHDSALSCAEGLHREGLLETAAGTVRAAGLIAGRAAVERPEAAEAKAIAAMRASDDQTEQRMAAMVEPLTFARLADRVRARSDPARRREHHRTVAVWREGSYAVTPAPVRWTMGAARRGRSLLRRFRG